MLNQLHYPGGKAYENQKRSLKNYKRFTDLHITEIPQSARLVVLVGPNGSGKSSVFDAFLLKANAAISNTNLWRGGYEGYLLKDATLRGAGVLRGVSRGGAGLLLYLERPSK